MQKNKKEFKKKNVWLVNYCLKQYGYDKNNNNGFHCRAGGAYHGNSCWQMNTNQYSFSDRIYLKQVIKGFDNPNISYALDILKLISFSNSSLYMIGDSLLFQLDAAFTCELRRIDGIYVDPLYYVSGLPDPFIILKDNSFKNKIPYYFHRINIFDLNNLQLIINKIILDYNNTNMRNNNNKVFIIVNGGAHQNHKNVMENLALQTLLYFHNITNLYSNIIFMYLETPASHFDTYNGYYNYTKTNCVPIKNLDPENDWRNYIIHKYINNFKLNYNNTNNINIIPLRKITEPLYREHVLGNFVDCTHYCWSPMLYQPVFKSIFNIINKYINIII